jgi:hypothetical protein
MNPPPRRPPAEVSIIGLPMASSSSTRTPLLAFALALIVLVTLGCAAMLEGLR